MHPHIHYTLSLFLSAESRESLHHRLPPGMSRKCMCGGDDHLAWKHPVTSKTCRRLRTTGGSIAPARDPFKRLPTHVFLEPPLTF